MPILGTIASSTRQGQVTGSYESIATIDAGGQNQVSFTSIPQTFQHLQIRIRGRSNLNFSSYPETAFIMRINGGSIRGAIYTWGFLGAKKFTVSPYSTTGQQELQFYPLPSANIESNVFGVGIVDIFDYANTNKNKTYKVLMGTNDGTPRLNRNINMYGALQQENSAISSIYITTDYNFSFATGTHFALYGIKSAS
jgi:hypothetical protein